MIRVRNFSYGEITDVLEDSVRRLNQQVKNGYKEFDFPDYAGLPKNLSRNLSSDEVDFIQENWDKL